MSERSDILMVGQLRCRVLLGTQAVYRVRYFNDELVQVEVVSAPGLEPGQRFVFTRQAVSAMDLVQERPELTPRSEPPDANRR